MAGSTATFPTPKGKPVYSRKDDLATSNMLPKACNFGALKRKMRYIAPQFKPLKLTAFRYKLINVTWKILELLTISPTNLICFGGWNWAGAMPSNLKFSIYSKSKHNGLSVPTS